MDSFQDLHDEAIEILLASPARRRTPDEVARLLADLRGAVESGKLDLSGMLWMLHMRAGLIASLDFAGEHAARSRLTREATLDIVALLRTMSEAHRGGFDLATAPRLEHVLLIFRDVLVQSGRVRLDWGGTLDEVADALRATTDLDGLEARLLADCWLAASVARSAQLRLEFLDLEEQEGVGMSFVIGRGKDFHDPTDDFLEAAFSSTLSTQGLPEGTTNLLTAFVSRGHAYVAAASTWLDALRRLCIWANYVESYVGRFQSQADEALVRGWAEASLTEGFREHLYDLTPTDHITLAITGLEFIPVAIWPRDGRPTAIPGNEEPRSLPGLLDVIKILAITDLSASALAADPPLDAVLLPPGEEDLAVRRAVALLFERAWEHGWANIEYVLAALRVMSLRAGEWGMDPAVVKAVAVYLDRERGAWRAIMTAQLAAARWMLTDQPLREEVSALFSSASFTEALRSFPYGIAAYVDFLGHCLTRIRDRGVLKELLDDLDRLQAHLRDTQSDLIRVLALRRGELLKAATSTSATNLRAMSETVLRDVAVIARVYDYPAQDIVETAHSWVSTDAHLSEQHTPGCAAVIEVSSWLRGGGPEAKRPNRDILEVLRAHGASVLALEALAHPAWGPISTEEETLVRRLLDDTAAHPPTGTAATASFYPMLADPNVAARLGLEPAERIAVISHALTQVDPNDPPTAARQAILLAMSVHDLCPEDTYFSEANLLSDEVASRHLAQLLTHDPDDEAARWFLIMRARSFLNSDAGSSRMRLWRALLLYLGYLLALRADDLDAACNSAAGLSEFFRFGSTAHRPTTDLWWEVYELHRREGGLSDPAWDVFHEGMVRNRRQGAKA